MSKTSPKRLVSLPFSVRLMLAWKAGRRRTMSVSHCVVDLLTVSLQEPWAKHLVKWRMPFQSLNLQEPLPPQRRKMRRRRRCWRPCSRGWPHSAARAAQPHPEALPWPLARCAHTPLNQPLLMYLLHYTSVRKLCILEKVFFTLCRGLGSQRIVLGTWCVSGSFTGVETEGSFRKKGKEFGLLAKHFWE